MWIKKFNKNLNKDHENEQRFNRWDIYRKRITNYIIQGRTSDENGSLLIVGAGNCEDLELGKIKDAFRSITLSDIDNESMIKGIKNQNIKGIEIKEIDYLGLDKNNFIEELMKQIEEKATIETIKEYIKEKLKSVVAFRELIEEESSYDYVVCTPIYTQLIFNQICESIYLYVADNRITIEEYRELERHTLDQMPKLVDTFNKGMWKLTKTKGVLIVFSDVLVDDINGKYYKLYNNGNNFDQVLFEYAQEYGVGIGHYGLSSLDDLGEGYRSAWFLWPFYKETILFVQGKTYNKS